MSRTLRSKLEDDLLRIHRHSGGGYLPQHCHRQRDPDINRHSTMAVWLSKRSWGSWTGLDLLCLWVNSSRRWRRTRQGRKHGEPGGA